MKDTRIAFIGGGNMARSLIGGLTAAGHVHKQIWVAEPDDGRRAVLVANFGVNALPENAPAVAKAEVVVLAVKPQVLREVAVAIAGVIAETRPLVVSIAAGVRTDDLGRWLGKETALVRAMPNTPAIVQSGATALYATPQVSSAQRTVAESILRAVGLTLWLDDEAQMDTVTALSGSGPAYFFLMMEALEAAACARGLPQHTARMLTLQTAFGAAKMALESTEDTAALRRAVTSPGGTTERAIEILEQGDLRALLARALEAAEARSVELAELLGGR